MKMILVYLLSLFAFSSLAQDRMGGQTGNGGNGCWYSDRTGNISWKTIEELKYWHLIAPEQSRYSAQYPNIGTFRLRIRPAGSYYEKNFLNTAPTKKVLQRLQLISKKFPNVLEIFHSYTGLLKKVTVAQYDIAGIYEGDDSHLFFKCRRFAPAILTQEDGSVIVYRPVWNSITALSSEIVILHEIIRFTQMFHPAFYDLSNEELQKLSALFFSVQNESKDIGNILDRFEKRLKL